MPMGIFGETIVSNASDGKCVRHSVLGGAMRSISTGNGKPIGIAAAVSKLTGGPGSYYVAAADLRAAAVEHVS